MRVAVPMRRAWDGPAILSYGFRPFFLVGAVWAVLSMALWLAMLSGGLDLPTAFDPITWHAHEAMFGFLGAIYAGFLLTAVPSWTGRPPLTGWALLALAALWLLGRAAVMVSAALPPLLVAGVNLAFVAALAGVIGRDILAAENWRNLKVLGLLLVFVAGAALFHWEAWAFGYAASGIGLRLALAATLLLIALIGGRVVPAFTRNWMTQRGMTGRLPAEFGLIDRVAFGFSVAALAGWVVAPYWAATGAALLAAGLVQMVRWGRWSVLGTLGEPLIWVLHVGYVFVPLGMLGMGAAILMPGPLTPMDAQHLWMAGAVGVMTLAFMTRAALGHTGRKLTVGAGTAAVYGLVIAAVLARLAANLMPGMAEPLHLLSGGLWCAGFTLYIGLYTPILIGPRADA